MSYPSYRRRDVRRVKTLTPPPALDPLHVLCRQIAARTAVDAVRLFLRDGDTLDRAALVLRARSDTGLPPPGVDGIADVVADTGRIIASPDDGEPQLPVVLGVPLRTRAGLLGVLVLRRRAPDAFHADDVERVRGLAAVASRTIERELARAAPASPLRGRPIVRGTAEGPVTAFPHELVARRLRGRLNRFSGAADEIGVELDDVRSRLRENVGLGVRPALAALRATLRASGLVELHLRDTIELHRALRGAGDDVVDLALLAAARAAGVPFPARGGVLVTRRWSSVLALAAVAGGVAGCAGSSALDPNGLAATILHAAHVPAMAGVTGLAELAVPGTAVRLDQELVTVLRSPR